MDSQQGPAEEAPAEGRAADGESGRHIAEAATGVASFLRENGADLVILGSLAALAVTVFLLKLDEIGIGGDAIRK